MDPVSSSFPFWSLIGIGLCVLLSALFSGTETALTALTERLTLQIMETKGKRAGVLAKWRDQPNRILSTLLVGNNLANIAASVLSVRVAVWTFRDYGANASAYADAAAVIGTTLLLLVFAEVTPKTFAKHNAVRISIPAMWFVRIVELPLLPVAWVMSRLGSLVVRVLGGNTSKNRPPVTEEDIEYMIELGTREAVFEEKERGKLLEAALDFGDVVAREVMIPRTEALALDADTPLPEALDHVIKAGHSRIPVFSESIDQIEGLLYAKDLLKMVSREDWQEATLRSLVRKAVFFVPESQKIADTLREMQQRRTHLGVVVDEFGGFSGIVTVEDILEELVGEIRDEYDHEEELVRQLDPNTYVANALISVRDLGELLGVEFPDDVDYETLGGFVVATEGRVPEVGSTFEWNGLSLEVLKADQRHVERVRITRLPSPDREPPEDPA